MQYAVLDEGSDAKRLKPAVHGLDRASLAGVLRGLFTADGTVVDAGSKSQYVGLDSTSLELLVQVQRLLLAFGVKAKLYENRRGGHFEAMLPDGRGGMKAYPVREMHSLRITRTSAGRSSARSASWPRARRRRRSPPSTPRSGPTARR